MSSPIESIEQVAFHRNGVCGAPFHAVLFRYAGPTKPTEAYRIAERLGLAAIDQPKGALFLGIVFDEPHAVAVLAVEPLSNGAGGVAFGRNSWRGDHFEAGLREAIRTHESDGSVRVGPFGIPTAPKEAAE